MRLPCTLARRRRLHAGIDNGGAAHVAHMAAGGKWRGAVHGAAVVPDHEIADAPSVAIYERRLRRELDQLEQQRCPSSTGIPTMCEACEAM